MSGAPMVWDGQDLRALLSLDRVGPGRFRSRMGDANLNGRAYGGQTLGQALAAASAGVGLDRPATMMQTLFLQGVDPHRPVDYEVTTLQQGKRFTSRHVRATQGDRAVLDAHASFAAPSLAPEHAAPLPAMGEDPRTLPDLAELAPWQSQLQHLSGYATQVKPSIDFRLPHPERQLAAGGEPRVRYWVRAQQALPADVHLHSAAFAYLSDWWLNFAALCVHIHGLPEQARFYVSSLNHAIWIHRPLAADQWLHVSAESPCAQGGRGFALARVHDEQGRLVASATQEMLIAPMQEGG